MIFLLRSRPSCGRCCANTSWGLISSTKFINTRTDPWDFLINRPRVGKQTPAVCLLHKKLRLEGKELRSPAIQERFQPRRRAAEGLKVNRAGNPGFPGPRVTSHSHGETMQGAIAPCENLVTSWTSWAATRAAPVPEPSLCSLSLLFSKESCWGNSSCRPGAGIPHKLAFSGAQVQARLGRASKLTICCYYLISFIIHSFLFSSDFPPPWGEWVQAGRIFLLLSRFPCGLKGDFEHFSVSKWCHQIPSSFLMLTALGFTALVEWHGS